MLKKYRRPLSAFLLLTFLANIISPTISLALTAGPTAPEATSFEPVDTTDMVNLATGDFVYNVPLLEVPGPSGGYPISLSYHAGIQPNEDASWAGLGFSLNHGAINRSVNGFADDFQDVTGSQHSFWEGGESRSLSVGINYSKMGQQSVSAGLSFSEDTYQGFSASTYLNAGSIGIRQSFDNGVLSTGISVGIGKGILNSKLVSESINVSYDTRKGLSASYSLNTPHSGLAERISGLGSMDISMATVKNAIKSFVGISTESISSKQGNVSTKGSNFSAKIPTPWGFKIQLAKSYQRYWIDEVETTSTNGSLYFPSELPKTRELDESAYDVYDLASLNESGIAPDENLTGSFIDYDNYQVTGHGISGNIRPFHYKAYLVRQNKKTGESDYRMKSYPLRVNNDPHFRFIGDFSNRYLHNMAADQFVDSSSHFLPLSFKFDSNRVTGESGSDGYDEQRNILPGSNHVEWFSNAAIGNGEAGVRGFRETSSAGFHRDDDNMIGGFMVTNPEGVVYHYSLPVYSFDEHQYSGKIDEAGKHLFNTTKNQHKYAYTWLLTAVTGPDYVDKNLNGLADQGDFGYWVSFDYGLWLNDFSWRNPSEGFNRDIDQQFETFSKGKKQIYYLNTIRTQTHTALFVKGSRHDGKSVVPEFSEAALTGPDHTFRDVDEGGFSPRTVSEELRYPASTLKLNRIYLLKNEDIVNLDSIRLYGGNSEHHYPLHRRDHVIDSLDVVNDARNNLREKAIRIVEFKTDYSLCPETPNSYISPEDAYLNGVSSAMKNKGKLTLRSIKVYGKNGVSMLPATKFNYDVNETFYGTLLEIDSEYYIKKEKFSGHPFEFKIGEIIKHERNGRAYYAYVSQILVESDKILLKPLKGKWGSLVSSSSAVFSKTKNPPYDKDFYDLWGLYKVDFNAEPVTTGDYTFIEESENVKRMVTSVSSTSTDVWSLREIVTPMGGKIKIEYEPDRYTSALKTLSNIPIKDIQSLSNGRTKLILYENPGEYGLKPGDDISFRAFTALRYGALQSVKFECEGNEESFIYHWFYHDLTGEINVDAVSANSLTVSYDFNARYPTGGYLNKKCTSPEDCFRWSDISTFDNIPIQYLKIGKPIFLGGEIFSDKQFSPYGGDLRVKKISLENIGETRSTLYEYLNGVTTYEPLGLAMPIRRLQGLYDCLRKIEDRHINLYKDDFLEDIYNKFRVLLANAREIPGPGVLYELVKVREKIEKENETTELPGWSEYQFEVFSPFSVDVSGSSALLAAEFKKQVYLGRFTAPQEPYVGDVLGLPVREIRRRSEAVIEDFSAIIGSLKRNTLYDGQGRKISETVNHYIHDDFNRSTFRSDLRGKFSDQGVISETFADARIIINPSSPVEDPDYTLYGLLSQKIKYPSIQTRQTTTSYKTGIKSESRTLAFDFYSGQTTQTEYYDGLGNTYRTRMIPAYKVYEGMGLAVNGHKNMLTQEAASYSYKIDPGDSTKIGLVSASVQTWSDEVPVLNEGTQPGIWRKHATYSFIGDNAAVMTGDGLYLLNDMLPEFNGWSMNDHASHEWQRNGAITLYDVQSHALEASDINLNYSATKMSSDQTRVFATAVNTRYDQFAYSGAEDNAISGRYGGGVERGTATEDTTAAHTGHRSLKATSGSDKAFKYAITMEPGKAYHASVWVNSIAGRLYYSINDIQFEAPDYNEERKSGSWYLLSVDIPPAREGASLVVWGGVNGDGATCHFDDFRVHPLTAAMNSYVYNQWGELWYALDNNNLYTKYEYDGMGRLIRTYRESFKNEEVKTGLIRYHYSGN